MSAPLPSKHLSLLHISACESLGAMNPGEIIAIKALWLLRRFYGTHIIPGWRFWQSWIAMAKEMPP
jgi:hypothetical protein